MIYEQAMRLTHPDGRMLKIRRITLVLDQPTENGDREIQILTNLPKRQFSGIAVAEGYRGRWTVENAFQELEQSLESEIRNVGLSESCPVGILPGGGDLQSAERRETSLAKTHGHIVPREQLSGYYLAEEISASYRGMLVAVPARTWRAKFASLAPRAMALRPGRDGGPRSSRAVSKDETRPEKAAAETHQWETIPSCVHRTTTRSANIKQNQSQMLASKGWFHAPYGPLDTGAGRAGGAFHAPYGLELSAQAGPAAP